jgi:subtilisin family serine protease
MSFVEPFLAQLHERYPSTVLVAAAGNDHSLNPFWPAAAAPGNRQVVSVGALRHTAAGLACFSNYGPWVSVYARGEGHVNAFPDGLYAYRHAASDTCRYRGLYRPCSCITDRAYGDVVLIQRRARWSGTSFATPLVAGMIASYMSTYQQPGNYDAREAARLLIETEGRDHIDHLEGLPMRVLL